MRRLHIPHQLHRCPPLIRFLTDHPLHPYIHHSPNYNSLLHSLNSTQHTSITPTSPYHITHSHNIFNNDDRARPFTHTPRVDKRRPRASLVYSDRPPSPTLSCCCSVLAFQDGVIYHPEKLRFLPDATSGVGCSRGW